MKYTSPMDPISIGNKPTFQKNVLITLVIGPPIRNQKHPSNVKPCQNGMSFSFLGKLFCPFKKISSFHPPMLQLSLEQWRQSLLLCTDQCLVYVVRLQWKKGWNHCAQTSPQLRWGGGNSPNPTRLATPEVFSSESASLPVNAMVGLEDDIYFPIGFR